MTAASGLRADRLDVLAALRQALLDGGFDDRNVADVFGDLEDRASTNAWREQILLRRTAEPTPLHTLMRLWVFGVGVDEQDARDALGPASIDDLVDIGLLRRAGSQVVGELHIRVFRGDYICSDFASRGGVEPDDFVMSVSPSGLTLAGATVRHQVDAALDVGTGSGFLAVLMARHARRVVATDINPRAVACAELSAALSGVELEVRQGSFFEPAAGRRFGLIVSNPPFVVTPGGTHMYLQGGLEADGVSHHIAQTAPHHLEDGGYCHFLASWVVRQGEDWEERIAGWFTGSHCDVWVLAAEIESPERHTLEWLPNEAAPGDAAAEVDRWLSYFERSGVSGIGTGLVTMRRTGGRTNLVAIDAAPQQSTLGAGSATEAGLDTRVWLHGASDDDILDGRYRIGDGVQYQQRWQRWPETGWGPASAQLSRTTGHRYERDVDPVTADLMAECETGAPLRDVVRRLAVELEVDPGALQAEALPVVRHLLLQGFLERRR